MHLSLALNNQSIKLGLDFKNYKNWTSMMLCLGLFLAGFLNEKIWLIDWHWSVWRAAGRHPQLG